MQKMELTVLLEIALILALYIGILVADYYIISHYRRLADALTRGLAKLFRIPLVK
jgi:hypothetical protein